MLAALILAAGIIPLSAAPRPAKPNILFIAVDDLRPELGCYGRDYIHSPNIDALAARGIVFDRAYCQQATCSPSRTSLLTGLRPDTTKVWDLVTSFRVARPDAITLPQNFKNQGYFAQGVGKIFHGGLDDLASWSVPWVDPKVPQYARPASVTNDGEVAASTEEDQPENKGAALGTTPAKASKGKKKPQHSRNRGPNSRGPIYESADVPDNTYGDGQIADLAVKALGEISQRQEPFFLAVGFHKPHLPWVAPKKYWDLYDPAKLDIAPNPFYPENAPTYAINQNDGEVRSYKLIPPHGPVPDETARKLKQAYFACVSYTDAQIGRVLAELDRLQLRTNTIIILWGDHGWKLGEHGAWGKHCNVETDVNAPLILSVPGLRKAGAHSRALVEFVDIYPTLSELAGLTMPGDLQGTSFKPLLQQPDRPWKPAAFSQFPRSEKGGLMGYTMRTDRYRFTLWVGRKDPTKVDARELYDHQNDPQENHNLANKPEQAELVQQLTTQWKAGWQGAKRAVAQPPASLRGS